VNISKFCQARFNSADEKLRLEQAALAQFDEELHDLEKDIKHKKQEIEDNLLATKKLEHDLTSQTADQSKLFNVLRNLEKQYPWILEEFK
jgi:septal ring factor EnvC (AmiA/AmiB activator)